MMHNFKVGDRVVCVDDDGYESYLKKGTVYEVKGLVDGAMIKINHEVTPQGWLVAFADRFQPAVPPRRFKPGQLIRCIDASSHAYKLTKGEVYECVDYLNRSTRRPIIHVFDGEETFTAFEDRFEALKEDVFTTYTQPAPARRFKAGDYVVCVDDAFLKHVKKGKIYRVKEAYLTCIEIINDGGTVSTLSNYRFELCSKIDRDQRDQLVALIPAEHYMIHGPNSIRVGAADLEDARDWIKKNGKPNTTYTIKKTIETRVETWEQKTEWCLTPA